MKKNTTMTDVLGIGNAIVDIISRCEDSFLEENNLPKGHMRLIDTEEAENLYEKMGPATEMSGGSAANTMVGIASFGGDAAFIGKTASDQLGKVFRHDIKASGVDYDTPSADNCPPTARCMVLVTPDGERTMNTYLGASVELGSPELDKDRIANSAITYLEGYLFDPPEAKKAFYEAAAIAQQEERKVALTLSDSFCVDRHRDELRKLIREGTDILFANEAEITALYQSENLDTIFDELRKECPLAAITRGATGSTIVTTNGIVDIPAKPVTQVEDTTGAGDLYAAGFLYGLSKEMPLPICGALGSLASAEIISHIGARPQENLAELAKQDGIPVA